MVQFSNDTQLRIGFRLVPLSMMSSCAAHSETWFTANRVKLTACKIELLYISTPNRYKLIEKMPLRVADDLVQPSLVVKHLGVIFDSTLTMIPHINSVCKSAYFQRTLLKPYLFSKCYTWPKLYTFFEWLYLNASFDHVVVKGLIKYINEIKQAVVAEWLRR